MKVVFNHDSLLFVNKVKAREGVECFIKIVSKFIEFDLQVILVDEKFGGSFYGIKLSSDYFWRDWIEWTKSNPHLQDLRVRFKSFATKTSMSLFKEKEVYESLALEIGLKGEDNPRITLLASYFHKSLLISFPTQEQWTHTQIEVWLLDLDSESSEKIDHLIPNIFDLKSFEFHLPDLKARRKESLGNGLEIWGKRKQFFPNLVLDNAVGAVLRHAGYPSGILAKFRDAMIAMNQFCEVWKNGGATYSDSSLEEQNLSVKISGESSSVFNNPIWRKQRMFWVNGELLYCEKHLKFAQGLRVYFYPCDETRTIYIVHFGQHFRTKKDP